MVKIYVRPDDLEEFIEVEPRLFSVKKSLEEFPNNIHHKYTEELLISQAFALKETLQINSYYIDAYPEMIWEIITNKGVIVVSEDPYEGLTVKYKDKMNYKEILQNKPKNLNYYPLF